MRVFLAGATGALGRPLLRDLVAAGHEVTGLTRSEERATGIRESGATAVVGDALDAERITALVAEAEPEVVVHALTAIPTAMVPKKMRELMKPTNRLRRDGTRILADAAVAAGARRLISESIAFAYEQGPGVRTEDDPVRDDAEYTQAVRELERITLGTPGIEGVVLRYGWFYGPGTSLDRDGSQTEAIRRRQFPLVGKGTGVWAFVHTDDAARATVAALGAAPGVYNVVDDEPAPASEWVPYVAELVGAKKPWRVPRFVARLAAGPEAASGAVSLPAVSNAKARAELGWQPRPWRDGFRDLLGG